MPPTLSPPNESLAIFWMRRDLRLFDNHGLFEALSSHAAVIPIFIFDTDILNKLENKNDRRVEFILTALQDLQEQLKKIKSSLLVMHGKPENVFKVVVSRYKIAKVYCNHDYEPDAIQRDMQIASFLASKKIPMATFKDQVIFEKNEVVKTDGLPYTVFTPYKNKWKLRIGEEGVLTYPSEKYLDSFWKTQALNLPGLQELGFEPSALVIPSREPNQVQIQKYKDQRDFPALAGTSRLSVHLRFGTVSIRDLVKKARLWDETWLNELIWREFYMMILFHFPHVEKGAFKPAYNHIPWLNSENDFQTWCEGRTGFPIVDAGMRELLETGFMHNRLRMITAGFLTKNLLVDWRWGEAWFAEKLLDYDLAANNGGWQWAAGTGCDAAPYFRIFSPDEQTRKFDPKLDYIRQWIPEFNTSDYPAPIVDYKASRIRALETYKKALGPK
jgi:deoxyribodipyrimidine photo-lyase